MSDLAKRLRIKAGMIEMGERIEWGSDTALMREAADALELAAPDVQGEHATLPWSEESEPNENIRYNHVTAETPLGIFSIEWKGWKPCDSMCIYLDGEYLDSEDSLEEAKAKAFDYVAAKAAALAAYAPSLRDVKQHSTSDVPVEQEPVGWQFYQDGKWWYGDDRIKAHRKNTEAAGIPVRDVYAAPQPAPDVSGLAAIAREIADLHAKRKVVLTVHVEALEDALAAYREQETSHDNQ